MKRIKLFTACAIGVLGVSSSFAAVSVPTGWYLEGNLGQSKVSNTSYGSGTSADDSGFGWNADLGFKFMPFFGLELGYTHYDTTEVKSGGTQFANDKHFSYDLAAKGILPISDSGVELFAKLGVARIKSHLVTTDGAVASTVSGYNPGTFTDTGLYMGLGGGYAFTPNIFGQLQWARAKGDSHTGNLDLYSLGITYTFC